MTRIVIVEKEKCNPEGCGGYLCARVSPSNRAGKEAFFKDVDGKIGVNEELVSEMDKIAVHKCPFHALKLIKLPEQLNEQPVHRYGKNGFVIFRLPVPIFGKVVGILGRNGIGKSTAVKILAGQLKANLGESNDAATLTGEAPTEKGASASRGVAPSGDAAPTGKGSGAEQGRGVGSATIQALIQHFKGNEAQGYFEKLRDKKIKLAYKPQQIEQIAKAYKGERIGSLLERINEKEKSEFDAVLKELQIDHLLDRNIDVISGGELQRVAIVATVLKNANVLFFDEPTNYLDIKQRIRTAHFIQNLANEERAVMLVDHDLIILDYMTELAHLFYGQENCYGIVSQPKATKAGINVYLSGYLKEENVRFREKSVTFPKHAEEKSLHDEKLAEWPAITKKIGTFTLEAEQGIIRKHDIIGVLGENGIGKTSFVRELAKIQGRTSRGSLKVSYKPQYLEETEGFDANELVGSFLVDALKYEVQLVKPLNLQSLFEKKLGELSGGQLQRVVIARALSADADLFLLDEPAAYLDVEQRLLMGKIIREMMEAKGKACLVVDHDLLFLDYLSEKLIVFKGEPGKYGVAQGPFTMQEGMNRFLKDLGITFRRDEENNRPRANKVDSVKDREQKASGKLYYAG